MRLLWNWKQMVQQVLMFAPYLAHSPHRGTLSESGKMGKSAHARPRPDVDALPVLANLGIDLMNVTCWMECEEPAGLAGELKKLLCWEYRVRGVVARDYKFSARWESLDGITRYVHLLAFVWMFSLLGSGLQHTIVVPVESTPPSITVRIPAERLTSFSLV